MSSYHGGDWKTSCLIILGLVFLLVFWSNPVESLRKLFGILPSPCLYWRDSASCRDCKGNHRIIPHGDYPVISQGYINGN